jgi:hypothetical protein
MIEINLIEILHINLEHEKELLLKQVQDKITIILIIITINQHYLTFKLNLELWPKVLEPKKN